MFLYCFFLKFRSKTKIKNMETESMNAASLKLTENSLVFMRETVKWAKFLAICSFVGLGLMVLVGVVFLFLSVSFPVPSEMKFSTSAVGIFYILIAVLYFFPAIYLYRFAIASAEAINTLNDDTLEEGLENLKSLLSLYKLKNLFLDFL